MTNYFNGSQLEYNIVQYSRHRRICIIIYYYVEL